MESNSSEKLLSGPYRATKLWNEIVEEFCKGVPLKRHRRQMRQYSDCFTARDAVDWLHRYLCQNPNFGGDVSRLQTIQLLCKLVQCNIICSVSEQSGVFMDNHDLYRLHSSFRRPLTSFQVSETAAHNVQSDAETPPLTIEETEYVWKCAVLDRLACALKLENLENVIDVCQMNAKHLIHNVNRIDSSGIVIALKKSEEIPFWVKSAMKCLAHWPKASGDESCLPKYPGFERDVYKVIQDYFLNLEEALTTPSVCALIVTIFERVHLVKSSFIRETAYYETAFMNEEPTTRVISPAKRHSSMASLIESRGEERFVNVGMKKIGGKSCSIDNLQRVQLSSNRASFRDRMKLMLKSNSKCAQPLSTDLCEAKGSLQIEALWLKSRSENASVSRQNSWSSASSFGSEQFSIKSTHQTEVNRKLLVDSIRLALLTLSPDVRRSLHLMLKFMDKVSNNSQLILDPKQSNQQVMLSTFGSIVLDSKDLNRSKALIMVEFMMRNQEDLFQVPQTFKDDVEKRLASFHQEKSVKGGSVLSFCAQVSKEEYERQKSDGFEATMLDLFNSIVNNTQLGHREKYKKLKQFKKMYPDIYSKAMPQQLSEQSKPSQLFRKLRVLRI